MGITVESSLQDPGQRLRAATFVGGSGSRLPPPPPQTDRPGSADSAAHRSLGNLPPAVIRSDKRISNLKSIQVWGVVPG